MVDTSHPMIRPQLEKGLDEAKKVVQSQGSFCLELDFGPAVDKWLKTSYPKGCCTIGSMRGHKARLCITNYAKPQHCFDCNACWAVFLLPCWLCSAPCYKVPHWQTLWSWRCTLHCIIHCFYQMYRKIKCKDIRIVAATPIVRRGILPNGKVVEISRCEHSTKYYIL